MAKKNAKRDRDTAKRRELRQTRGQRAAWRTLLLVGAVIVILGVIVYVHW
jgi:hypothetical protein